MQKVVFVGAGFSREWFLSAAKRLGALGGKNCFVGVGLSRAKDLSDLFTKRLRDAALKSKI